MEPEKTDSDDPCDDITYYNQIWKWYEIQERKGRNLADWHDKQWKDFKDGP